MLTAKRRLLPQLWLVWKFFFVLVCHFTGEIKRKRKRKLSLTHPHHLPSKPPQDTRVIVTGAISWRVITWCEPVYLLWNCRKDMASKRAIRTNTSSGGKPQMVKPHTQDSGRTQEKIAGIYVWNAGSRGLKGFVLFSFIWTLGRPKYGKMF